MARKLFASFLFLISTLCSFNLNASHMAGGEITYKYIGNSVHPYRYEITLKLYRRNESGSAAAPSTATVFASSSCFSTQSITMSRWTPPFNTPASDGGYEFPDYLDCGDPSSPDYENLSIHFFGGGNLPGSPNPNNGIIDLPGKCADFSFSYELCCRAGTIVNLDNPASYSFFIQASLNNTVGENSSPEFTLPPGYSFCLNQSSLSLQSVTEPDGDSIYYRLSPTREASSSYIPYQSGFSASNPVPSSTPVSINPENGILHFTPGQVGMYTVVISIEEYRFNSTFNAYLKIGEITRDYNIVITPDCSSNFAGNAFGGTGVPGIINDVACGDPAIILKVEPIFSFSLAPDGSDFAILNSKGFLLPIVKAEVLSIGQSFYADSIVLFLSDSIYYNDILTIFTRKGSDLNTLINTCGTAFPANDSAKIFVNDCQTWVGLRQQKITSDISIYPNPADDMLIIDLGQHYSANSLLKIGNMEGKILRSLIPGSQKMSLDVSGFPPGIYVITLESGNGSVHQKFQKL